MKLIRFALPTTLAISACAVLAFGACSDDPAPAAPTGACAPTDPTCPTLAVASDCQAVVDNSGKDKFALRMSQLSLEKPAALVEEFVYKLVATGVYWNLPQCNIVGDGTFSLITEFDKTTGKVRSGGALPVADPTEGYCFDYDAANNVSPVEVNATLGEDGSFETEPIPLVVVPIYQDLTAADAIYLPLREARIHSAKISADQNCIGSFNATGLEPGNLCLTDYEPDPYVESYINGATLDGYITLEEADEVLVPQLNQTLCVLLSGDSAEFGEGDKPIKCKRDGGTIVFEGDWCSTDNAAGGCKDAVELRARLAAAAVELRDDCVEGPMGSGGGGAGGSGEGGAGGSGEGGAGGSGQGGAGEGGAGEGGAGGD